MKKETKDLALLKFREKLFLEELEQYKIALTGEYESILPYVRDEKGHYSEEKTCALIEELSGYVRIYREYEAQMRRQELLEKGMSEEEAEEWSILAEYNSKYGKAEESFIKDFLYCALRISEMDELCNPGKNDISGATQTFHDLLWYSSDHYEKSSQLYAKEALSEAVRNHYADLKGIYRPASWLFHILTGQDLSALSPKELQKEYAHYLPDEIRLRMEEENCTPSEYFQKFHPDLFEKEKRIMADTAKQIRKKFAEPEKFVQSYLSFREKRYDLRYEKEIPNLTLQDLDMINISYGLEEYIKAAVQMFAEHHGFSHYQDDELYFTALAQLRKTGKTLKIMAKQGRGKHS